MTKKEEACEQRYCYLPKGHGGLHHVKARIYDTKQEEKIKEVEDIRDRLVVLNCPVFNLNLWIEQLKHTKEQG